MNKREFIKLSGGATMGIATLTALPAAAVGLTSLMTTKTDAVTRRRNTFPNVPLLTHEGKLVNFYDDLIKDKTVLINFMYVRCGEICPGMTVNLKRVQEELGERMGKDVFMYSISLDQDTPEILKAYAELFKTKPGWTFLTGKKDDIELIRTKLGVKSPNPELDKDKTQHTGMLKYGVESLERWGMTAALGDPKQIAKYVRRIEPKSSLSV